MKDNHTWVICAYGESDYLEACIQSLKNQTLQSQIICYSSTPLDSIKELCKRYDIPFYTKQGGGIGKDWNNAISFVEKEAAAYDEAAVLENKKKLEAHSQLQQWPVQIKLVPINAPYFDDADLLIAADCTAYAYANFHQDFIKGKITLIGCPKLDSVDYSEKLTEIIRQNNIKSVTIVRMEVPCCGGIQNAAINAMKASGKFLPWQVYTISTDGRILA